MSPMIERLGPPPIVTLMTQVLLKVRLGLLKFKQILRKKAVATSEHNFYWEDHFCPKNKSVDLLTVALNNTPYNIPYNII